MIVIYIISILSVIGMLICIIKYPKLTIKEHSFDTFYLAPLIGAILLLVIPLFDKTDLFDVLKSNTSVNPLKILVLFISISVISISLDTSGFFSYLASRFIKRYKSSQIKLFISLYFLIALITIFTSNDIVILTFTPFILYLAKKGGINPIPYLVMEFVSGNTYSILLEIGNPTNIYLSSVYNIDFLEYIKVMIIPTLIIGISSILGLLVIFRKDLKKEIEVFELDDSKINDKVIFISSLSTLIIVIILMAISNIINIEMWIITLVFACVLTIIIFIYGLFKKRNYLKFIYIRIPYTLIPFILSMFVIVMALDKTNLFTSLTSILTSNNNEFVTAILYLLSSIAAVNVINNIPMTLAYSKILNSSLINVYSVIISSNIGALLMPEGALAGIMWNSMLRKNEIKYSFKDFLINGLKLYIFILPATILSIFIMTLML